MSGRKHQTLRKKMPTSNPPTGAKMASDKVGEPVALFAVPLPSACKSDYLCLCKRLFWSVGASYYSAFCPLTSEETRSLPYSSSVVQLVSVTPAVPESDARARGLSQDLLAYTLWGDIVGIPYVSISTDTRLQGRMTRKFPFEDLSASAWVPAVNAPFVGATGGKGAGSMSPAKDIFIIRNDERTRQSLLTGQSVVFSQQDGQLGASTSAKELLLVRGAAVPTADLAPATDLTSVAAEDSPSQPDDCSPQPDDSKRSPSKMSPTSSSLYKLYHAHRRTPEKSAPSSSPVGEPSQASPELSPPGKGDGNPPMMLPRIESVFSLADAKEIDSLVVGKRASPVQGGQSQTSSASLTNGIGQSAFTWAGRSAGGSPKKPNLVHALNPAGSLSTVPRPDTAHRKQTNSAEAGRAQHPTSETCPIPNEHSPKMSLVASTKRQPLTVRQELQRKRGCITVKELLEKQIERSIPTSISPKPLPSRAEDVRPVASVAPITASREVPARAPVNGHLSSIDERRKNEELMPRTEAPAEKPPSVDAVAKVERAAKESVEIPRSSAMEGLVIMDRRIPRLQLHRLDISRCRPGVWIDVKDWTGEISVSSEVTTNGSKDLPHASSANGKAQTQWPNVAPKSGKRKRRKKGRPRFVQKKHSGYKKQKLGQSPQDFTWSVSLPKKDEGSSNDRKRLSECQNMILKKDVRETDEFPAFHSLNSENLYRLLTVGDSPAVSETRRERGPQEMEERPGAGEASQTVAQDDAWDLTPSSSDAEWECLPGKGDEEEGDGWGTEPGDGTKAGPAQQGMQPIKATPFGDFRHMVLKDRVRLLEETLKEHKAALREIHGNTVSP